MSNENKRNLLYFESDTMRGLYEMLDGWQIKAQKRLLSIDIQQAGGRFCCIALTNPTEVIICSGEGEYEAKVSAFGSLRVIM